MCADNGKALSKLKVPELKELLKANGLQVSGKKAVSTKGHLACHVGPYEGPSRCPEKVVCLQYPGVEGVLSMAQELIERLQEADIQG